MSQLPRNFGWDRHKLKELTYEQLESLEKQIQEEHACNNGIHLLDAKGRKKLDAVTWAVYYKNKQERANESA